MQFDFGTFQQLLVILIPTTLAVSAPIIITAIGGLYSERSGVVNIGLEGMMVIGAFTCALTILGLEKSLGIWAVVIALVLSALAGAILALFHAFASISMRANQIISGTAINIMGLAGALYACRVLFNSKETEAIGVSVTKFGVPFLKDIPFIGPILFDSWYPTMFIVIGVVLFTWYLLYYRPFGYHLRACGEHPGAADSMGINVTKMRYIGVIISGVLAGLGGALVVLTISTKFSELTIAGMGFLALAALVFGKWNPFGVLGAGLFFGLTKTLGIIFPVVFPDLSIPNVVFQIFPYVMTILALVLFSRKSAGPKAAGVVYDKGSR